VRSAGGLRQGLVGLGMVATRWEDASLMVEGGPLSGDPLSGLHLKAIRQRSFEAHLVHQRSLLDQSLPVTLDLRTTKYLSRESV